MTETSSDDYDEWIKEITKPVPDSYLPVAEPRPDSRPPIVEEIEDPDKTGSIEERLSSIKTALEEEGLSEDEIKKEIKKASDKLGKE